MLELPSRSRRAKVLASVCLCALLVPVGWYWTSIALQARAQERPSCIEDAMIVFDASKSMDASDDSVAGLRRIDSVRGALAKVLPKVTRQRRLGLVTYGPGSRAACDNVSLSLRPQPEAAKRILTRVNALQPAGRTPLTFAVELAANVLDYRHRAGTIVVVTDGEDTCGGAPCELAKRLQAEGPGLVVHVIGYRLKSSLGSSGAFQSRCLADDTGGLYISTDTVDELEAALEKTLSCPLLSRAD